MWILAKDLQNVVRWRDTQVLRANTRKGRTTLATKREKRVGQLKRDWLFSSKTFEIAWFTVTWGRAVTGQGHENATEAKYLINPLITKGQNAAETRIVQGSGIGASKD